VRLVHKDFPLQRHELARPAHEAARCAGAAGRYFPYRERLFAEQPRFEREALIAYAVAVGLDRADFARCLDTRRHAAAVDRDIREARALGITATPSFVVNGRVVVGAYPVEAFRDLVNEALAAERR
jgi:protein-disulfide isomerase